MKEFKKKEAYLPEASSEILSILIYYGCVIVFI